MDLALFIKSRLEELGLEQKDLAASAQVTESYISQLLARKKVPPSAGRTEIYARMSRFLKLPEGELSKLADLQRRERLQRILSEETKPLHPDCRDLLVTKCAKSRRKEVRVIFERNSFGELERLITQTFLTVARALVSEQKDGNEAISAMADLSRRRPEQIRAESLAFLNSEPLNISDEVCAPLLASVVEWWDVDLKTFGIDLVPNRKLLPSGRKHFEFVETPQQRPAALQSGFQEFLADTSLSGDATQEELAFLQKLTFNGRRPTRIYYYRQLQNLRDPLNFDRPLPLRSSTQKNG